ncbi:MAG: hypothetical protein ACTHKB_00770 [Burkholderiaceae bacterium]
MSRFHVRCRQCETRRVLPKHPEEYLRLPPCRHCGAKSYRVDKWMNRRNTLAMSCGCAGYIHLTGRPGWRHRQGSKYCWHRKDGTQRLPGDSDYFDALEEREKS